MSFEKKSVLSSTSLKLDHKYLSNLSTSIKYYFVSNRYRFVLIFLRLIIVCQYLPLRLYTIPCLCCGAGGRYKSWKRRWFILNDNCLYYFEYTTDKEPRGIIPLENILVREATDRHKPYCLELYASGTDFIKACKTDSEGKVVEGMYDRCSLICCLPKDMGGYIVWDVYVIILDLPLHNAT